MADGDVSLDASGNTVLLDTGNECLVPCCVGCANLTHAAVVRCAFSGVTLSSTCVGCSGAEGKINSGTLGTYDTAYATTSSGVDFHQATTAVVGEFCLDHSTSFATVQIKTNCDTDSSALVEVLNGGRRSFRGSFDRCDLLAGAVVVNNEFTATGCIGGTTTATGSGGSVTLTLITP